MVEEKKIKTFTSTNRKGGSRTLDKSGKVIKEIEPTKPPEDKKKKEDKTADVDTQKKETRK